MDLMGMGENSSGQLGDGTSIDGNFPVKVGTDTNWVSVSAGDYSRLPSSQMGPYGHGERVILIPQ